MYLGSGLVMSGVGLDHKESGVGLVFIEVAGKL